MSEAPATRPGNPAAEVLVSGFAQFILGLFIGMVFFSMVPLCIGIVLSVLTMFVLHYSPSRIGRARIVLGFIIVWSCVVGLHLVFIWSQGTYRG